MFGNPVENDRGWEVKKLGEIATSQIGITYKPENVSDDGEGIVVLRSGNIQESEISLDDIVRVKCPIKEDKYVKKGDILMCSRNGSYRLVGKVAMIPELRERMTYGAFMTIIRSDYQCYLFEFFKTQYFRMQLSSAQTSTINQITVKMLNEIVLTVPPLSLQQEFAEKIEKIEKQKELIRKSIEEVETLFNSRMDYYFG
jgi:type I restriction enzyme S subunit